MSQHEVDISRTGYVYHVAHFWAWVTKVDPLPALLRRVADWVEETGADPRMILVTSDGSIVDVMVYLWAGGDPWESEG